MTVHISLSQIFLAPENSYKMKKCYYEYPRVSPHSESKLHNYVSNDLTSWDSLQMITQDTNVFAVISLSSTHVKQGL